MQNSAPDHVLPDCKER